MAAVRPLWRIDLSTKSPGYGSLLEAPTLHLPGHTCAVIQPGQTHLLCLLRLLLICTLLSLLHRDFLLPLTFGAVVAYH